MLTVKNVVTYKGFNSFQDKENHVTQATIHVYLLSYNLDIT